jgi:omega-6 fatty acid desaturase (delta-12 desaturase)
MVYSLEYSYWYTLALSILAAGFLVRAFIIFHDCTHGSFFNSRKANDFWGIITGLLAFTPYSRWRHDHAIHHKTAANLDKRGTGDVMTLTVKEYQELPTLSKLGYRLLRSPLVMFGFGPLWMFVIMQRIPPKGTKGRELRSVWYTNLALAGIISGMHFLIGIKAYLLIQMPVMYFAGLAGLWLFYVQHNFENSYWVRTEEWSFLDAGLKGASYYKLPGILRWFSGDIGIHHIHHLSPRIPNYYLQACLDSAPMLQVKPLTILASLKSLKYRLWDEDKKQLVGFS